MAGSPRRDAVAPIDGWSEADLVAGARRHDEAAIRAIIRLYNQTLFRLARGIVADDEAEDVLQDAYLRAFGGIDGFRGEASLRTWLGRIVVNTALERLRRKRPTLQLAVLENADPEHLAGFPLAGAATDPERGMAQDQVRRMLEQAIGVLPPDFRSVVMARLLEELSVEETAQILDLKPETVKTRLHRARKLLRAAMEKRLGAVFADVFPFGNERCQRTADRVVEGLIALQ
jgi:RNA polymerase sigma-70 factor (ECF subfamily)